MAYNLKSLVKLPARWIGFPGKEISFYFVPLNPSNKEFDLTISKGYGNQTND